MPPNTKSGDASVSSMIYLGPYKFDLSEPGAGQPYNTVTDQINSLDYDISNDFVSLLSFSKLLPYSGKSNSHVSEKIKSTVGAYVSHCNANNNADTPICTKGGLMTLLQKTKNTYDTFKEIYSKITRIVEEDWVGHIRENILSPASAKFIKTLKEGNANIKSATDGLTESHSQIERHGTTVSSLQKKIQLALKVLNGEGNRLQSLTKNLATYRAQNAQQDQDRVPIGLPYLNPFFTMSNRNYVIMMLVFIVLLVIGIFVYAFVGWRSTV